ncbi:alginate export family protein [Nguyenibacter vanlangensis]|uniref:Alginate export family protein n=1 Tax=Nguyenibacter vanlangensis TaxID=1216886 RepID=A0ABZ3D8C3_9PROT
MCIPARAPAADTARTTAPVAIQHDGKQATGPVSRPPIQTFPHAGPVGQPRRLTPAQLAAPTSTHGPWGVFNAGNGESAGFGPIGRYGVNPAAENWQYLRNPHLHDDPFDALKFIPLNRSGTIWLTFSGETRVRNWFEQRPNLGTRSPNDSGRMSIRNLYGADLHLGEHVRLFTQLINADSAGWSAYGYNTTYRKRLDVQQAFLELTGRVAGAHAGFIFGRQQFLDAPSYILYARETPSVPLSWNGFRTYAFWPRIRIDAYDFVQTNDSYTSMFRDTENYQNRLYGFNTTWAPGPIAVGRERMQSFLDLFYIGYKLAGSAAAIPTATKSASGATTRNNFGFRWHGSAPSFEFSVGGVWQGGTFNYATTNRARDVSAFAVNSIIGYRHTPSPLHPFMGVQADIYSGGDAAPTRGTVGTYIAPYSPQTNYLDTTTYIAPSNLVSLSPVLRITPRDYVSFQLKAPFMWREDANAPIFTSSARYTFPRPYNGGFIGVVPQAALSLQLNRHLNWTQYVARFVTSNGLKAAGASDGTYYQSNFVFRF